MVSHEKILLSQMLGEVISGQGKSKILIWNFSEMLLSWDMSHYDKKLRNEHSSRVINKTLFYNYNVVVVVQRFIYDSGIALLRSIYSKTCLLCNYSKNMPIKKLCLVQKINVHIIKKLVLWLFESGKKL